MSQPAPVQGGPLVPMKTKILSVFQSIHKIPVSIPAAGLGEKAKAKAGLEEKVEVEAVPENAVAGFRTEVVTSNTDYIGFDEKSDPKYYKIDTDNKTTA